MKEKTKKMASNRRACSGMYRTHLRNQQGTL